MDQLIERQAEMAIKDLQDSTRRTAAFVDGNNIINITVREFERMNDRALVDKEIEGNLQSFIDYLQEMDSLVGKKIKFASGLKGFIQGIPLVSNIPAVKNFSEDVDKRIVKVKDQIIAAYMSIKSSAEKLQSDNATLQELNKEETKYLIQMQSKIIRYILALDFLKQTSASIKDGNQPIDSRFGRLLNDIIIPHFEKELNTAGIIHIATSNSQDAIQQQMETNRLLIKTSSDIINVAGPALSSATTLEISANRARKTARIANHAKVMTGNAIKQAANAMHESQKIAQELELAPIISTSTLAETRAIIANAKREQEAYESRRGEIFAQQNQEMAQLLQLQGQDAKDSKLIQKQVQLIIQEQAK